MSIRDLCKYIKDGNVEGCRELIKMGINVNNMDYDGIPPLCAAVWYKKSECVRILLEAGARVTISHLHRTIMNDDVDTLRILLERVPVNVIDAKTGFGPLHIAVLHGKQTDCARLLLEEGVHLNIKDNDGLLAEELTQGNKEIIEMISTFKFKNVKKANDRNLSTRINKC